MKRAYYRAGGVTLHHGDSLEIMRGMPAEQVTAVVTDPPYGLGFMGKEWDHGIPGVEFWRAARNVAKPGAVLLAFGGTRTFHRLTCAIEDAGWQIRDCLMWLYGSGFPKSHDISKAIGGPVGATWNGYGTSLKPAWEPIVLAMKPLDGTFAENAERHGVAGISVDRGRVEGPKKGGSGKPPFQFGGRNSRPFHEHAQPREFDQGAGRWPANLALDEDAAALLDEQSGDLKSGARTSKSKRHSKKTRNTYAKNWSGDGEQAYPNDVPASTGGASRFFYCAKSSKKDRGEDNTHPTVKPLALMRWLVRLVTMPTDTVVLDPFAGSGSTLLACREENVRGIGIELEEDACKIAVDRMAQSLLSFGEGEP